MDRHASFAAPSIGIRVPEPAPITRFEPQKTTLTPHVRGSGDDDYNVAAVPERRLTVLAMQLAIFEKTVSRLSTLAFIWATVVLLGGFAITLSRTDFWCITILLLIEGARIQGRSHELEWEQKATWRPPVTSQAVALVLHWLQLLFASVCVSISLLRLLRQRYGNGRPEPWTNRHAALDIFYGLALVESLVFLVEKVLWQWEVVHRRIIERVAKECHLATVSGVVTIRRFFYDSYSRSLKGSIFDGLHMDLVSYADNLFTAGFDVEQSIAASIMVALAEVDRFANSTLSNIGMSATSIERLIQMLSWKDKSQRDVRRSAAVVVSMLTGKQLIALRVTGIPGAIDSIASLLYADLDDELNLLGLSILNKLAHDHDNCEKIGKTRNLLDKIISYCSISNGGGGSAATAAPPTDTRLKAVMQSLLLVKTLAGTTGTTGKLLRREISYIVFTVSNIREVLQQRDGRVQSELYQLAIETLASLAMDNEAREKIGGTGGFVKELVALFLLAATKVRGNRQTDAIRVQAGEALAMLSLESSRNCGEIIMACGGVGPLVDALGDPVVTMGAARILRNLCTYVGDEWQLPLRGVTAGAIKVLSTIMVVKGNILNIFLGLAAQMLRFMVAEELRASLTAADVTETALAQTLLLILREYDRPSMVVPRIRWYTIEFAVAMMRLDARYVALFLEHGMEGDLRSIAGTTSELECFNVFLGSVGLGRRAVSVSSLVTSAMELMKLQR